MRNLVVFDLETTGLDKTKHQIIQYAGIKIDQDTNEIIDELNIYIQPHKPYLINIQAYIKHGISPEFLADKPHIEDVAQQIINFMKDCDILSYNGLSFDLSFLIYELNKYGFKFDVSDVDCYDSFIIEKRIHGMKLEDTYKRYTGHTMEENGLEAHNALSDVKATLTIFNKQKEAYPELAHPEKVYGEDNVIVEQKFLKDMMPCFNIGKYKGLSLQYVANIDQNYLKWCVSDKSSFMDSTKRYIQKYIIMSR